jgi:RNA polymerase sigma factor (sigma-70 family)
MTPRFEELIDRHHDEIFAYLWRLLGKARRSDVSLEIEDLVQDVFMRAYEAFPKLRPDSNHRAWLYKIATNRAFTKLRRAKLRHEKFARLKESPQVQTNLSAPENNGADLRAAVERLSPKQRACVTLRYFNDLDYSEIAAIVGCSAVSARSNVSQALRQLGKLLQEPS